VLDHLPEGHTEEVKTALPAAATLLEVFTINRLGLPPSLYRCLATTNIIESRHAGTHIPTRRGCHW
jgi:hypothetical protein